MPDFRDRRSVLRAGAALCSLSLAGCFGDGGDDDGNATDSDDGTAPGGNVSDDGTDETDGNSSDDEDDPGGDPDWETIERWRAAKRLCGRPRYART